MIRRDPVIRLIFSDDVHFESNRVKLGAQSAQTSEWSLEAFEEGVFQRQLEETYLDSCTVLPC